MTDQTIRRFYDEKVYGEHYTLEQSRSIPRRLQILPNLLGTQAVRPSGRVLDIGPEGPTIPRYLASHLSVDPANYHCIDVTSQAVALTKEAGFPSHVIDISTDTVPSTDQFYDLVIMAEVIEHLTDPDHALMEVHRVLRPGGFLVVTTPNLASWINRFLLLFGIQPMMTETSTQAQFGWGRRGWTMKPVGHLRLYTQRALLELLTHYGFGVEKVRGLPYGPNLLRGNRIAAIPDRVASYIPSLSGGFLVIAART